MSGGVAQFDYDQAVLLQKKITGEIDTMNQSLEKTQALVNSMPDWWEGESVYAFISEFTQTKKKILKNLQNWLSNYATAIQDEQKQYTADENDLKRAVSKS